MNVLRSGFRCLRDIGAAKSPMRTTTAAMKKSNYPLARRPLTTAAQPIGEKDVELVATLASESDLTPTEYLESVSLRNFARDFKVDVPYARPMPETPSYFSRQPTFIDSFVEVQRLAQAFGRLPTVRRDQLPPAAWKSKEQYCLAVGEKVKGRDYAHCMKLVKQLYLIHPDLVPEDVTLGIRPFQRDIRIYLNKAAPIEVDKFGRTHAAGRRKTSVAQAWLVEGTGDVIVNGKPLNEAFARVHDRESALWALKSMNRMDKYNVWAKTSGGGTTGQAEALAMAIGKCLAAHEPAMKSRIRRAGCLTRDPRMVERKKPGHYKARATRQWNRR